MFSPFKITGALSGKQDARALGRCWYVLTLGLHFPPLPISRLRTNVKNMKYCAVFNCTTSSGMGVSMFEFPKDKRQRKVYLEFLAIM